MPSTERNRWAIALSLGIVWIVWGSSYLAIAVAIESIPPFAMAATRFLVAGVLLLAYAALRGKQWPRPRQWAAAALVGALMLVGGNGLVTWAELTVPSSIAALLITTVPLWMTVLDGLVYGGRRPTMRTAIGLVVGFAGVGILVRPSGDDLGALPVWGSIALLVASFSWAHGSLLSRRLPLPASPLMAVGAEMACAGAILALIALARGEAATFDPGAVTFRSIAALGYLVVFASIAALTAYQYLLRTISASAVSTYAFVNPIVAVALGWWLASEPVTARVLVAGGLIIAAVVVILGVWERPRTQDVKASVGARIPGGSDGGQREAHAEA